MIFNRLLEKRETISVNEWKTMYSFENGYDITPFDIEMKESTYFSCIKIISESIAKCTLQVKKETEKGEELAKDHYLYDKLRIRPNDYMSAIDCYKAFVALSKHWGHSGLFIDRQGSKINGLYPVKITNVTIDNAGLIKSIKGNKILWDFEGVEGEIGSCFDKDIIMLRDFTMDGIKGKANRSILSESLDSSLKSQNYLNKLFSNGLTNKIVVQLTSDIKEEKELKKVQEKFDRIYTNNGRVFTIPAGYNVQPMNLSLSDAQFTELRKLSKEEIASSFQVPLSKLGIMRDTAVSEEQDNIKFLTDCLLIIFEQIEQEMDWKLLTQTEREMGYKIRFNINVLLRTDSKTQSEVISTYVKNGIYDLDYARDILGVQKIGGELIITLPSGQVLLKDLINGNVSYQKGKQNTTPKDGDNIDSKCC
ncbi:phage portal protein [Clostridium beijerinckii]|uniref:phage portal protein n=1 Tax=Clostridium beijerinckii TaxID=1520 RepID=UPI00098BCF18|nr:phage portal protein [Clostridium beijerinckii]MBA8936487.1 HK97 family phage portal protein [Clostridium beijerinckii]NRU41045.1 HK97 family phage portal protein [Clostridium beijerinckii]NSA95680.1 HK97 family phage portal protein [Clostridium beijerinckii]OOM67037.1 phage portal protein [Clostridium beijerinckii]OOM70557.1 phage portal protein [Clostridium beijerinckii]